MKRSLLLFMVLNVHYAWSQNITGGFDIDIENAPYQVSIRENGSHFCGGSIINNKYILTAAHCLQQINVAQISVQAGFTSQDNPGPNAQTLSVKSFGNHPGYDPGFGVGDFDSDIAWIELNGEFTFNDHVQPIRLVNSSTIGLQNIGNTVRVSGWGWTIPGDATSAADHLQAVDVPIISNSTAAAQLAVTSPNHPPVTNNMIATDAVSNNTLGSCRGDSGGPLVHLNNGDFVQIGVVSFGTPGCLGGANAPSIYTKVSNFNGWLNNEVWSNSPMRIEGPAYVCENTDETFRIINVNPNEPIQWTVSSNLMIVEQTKYEVKVRQSNLSSHHGWVRASGGNVNMSKGFEVGVPHAININVFKAGSQILNPNAWNWIQATHNGSYDYNISTWQWTFYASSGVTIASMNGSKSTIHINPSTSGTVDVRARVANQCGYSEWKDKIFQIGSGGGGGGTGGPPLNY